MTHASCLALGAVKSRGRRLGSQLTLILIESLGNFRLNPSSANGVRYSGTQLAIENGETVRFRALRSARDRIIELSSMRAPALGPFRR